MAFDDNLGGRWNLSGGSYTDASPNGNDLTASVPAPTQIAGFDGAANAALDFNGTNNELRITDAAQTGLDFSTACTMRFRIYIPDIADEELMGKYGFSGTVSYRTKITSGRFHILLSSNGTSWNMANTFSNKILKVATWYEVGFTFDGSYIRIYINGYLDNTIAASGTIFNSTSAFVIGSNSPNTVWGDVVIDDVEVWSRTLSASEMEAAYNRTDDFSTTPGTLPGYSYSDNMIVKELDSVELIDYQIKLEIQGNTPGPGYIDFANIQAMGEDIRFTLSNGLAKIDYWIEAWDDAAKIATIWVALPSLTADETKLIKIQYGNSSAIQASNLGDTMLAGVDSNQYGFRKTITKAAASGQGSKLLWAPIVLAGNGDWLCFYNDSNLADDDATRVVVKRSTDQGATWGSLLEVASGTYHVGEPVAFVDPGDSDKVWCFYDEFISSGSDGGTIKYKTSTDHGATWSSATTITTTEDRCVCGTFLETSGGTWLLAFASFTGGTDRTTRVMRSINNGSSWTEYGSIGVTNKQLVEPQIVEKDNGDLFITMRSDNTIIYESESTDDGLTWSAAASTGLNTSYARHGLAELPNGDWVLCHHNEVTSSAHPRNVITCQVSDDEASTWTKTGIVTKTFNDAGGTGKNGNIWVQMVDGYLVVTWVNYYDVTMCRYNVNWIKKTFPISLSSADDNNYTVNGVNRLKMSGSTHKSERKSSGVPAIQFDNKFDRPVIIESYHKVIATSNNVFVGTTIGSAISNSATYVFFDLPGSPGNERGQIWDGTAQQFANENWAGVLSLDTLYRSKYILLAGSPDDWNIDTFESGNPLIDVDLTGEPKADDYQTDLVLGHGTDANTAGAMSAVQVIFARKYTPTEPSVTLGADIRKHIIPAYMRING